MVFRSVVCRSLVVWCSLLAAMPLFACAKARADQAVTYQLNIAHTGVGTTTGLVPPLTQKWSVSFPGAPSYAVIAEGDIYVVAPDSTTSAVDVYALSPADGHTIWGPVKIADPSFSYSWGDPAYDAGQVFVVDEGGFVVALNAKTGKQNWGAQMPLQYDFSSPPTAHNGIVYVVGAGEGGTLYALNETNGDILWMDGVENGDNSSPCIGANTVYTSFVGPQTLAANLTTGAEIWYFGGDTEGGGGATPVYSDGNLYIIDTLGSFFGYRMDAATGAIKGTFDSEQPPAIDGNTGFVVLNGSVQAQNMLTQAILWTKTIPADRVLASPIVVNHVVYCTTGQGMLYGFDEATGSQVVSLSLGDTASPRGLTAAQGLLLAPTNTHLVAFD